MSTRGFEKKDCLTNFVRNNISDDIRSNVILSFEYVWFTYIFKVNIFFNLMFIINFFIIDIYCKYGVNLLLKLCYHRDT